MILNEITTF